MVMRKCGARGFSPLAMISGTTIGHEALLKKPCFRCTIFGWLEILAFKTLHCSRIGNWAGEVTPYLSDVSHIRTYRPFGSVTKKILCGYMRLHRAARNLGRWVVIIPPMRYAEHSAIRDSLSQGVAPLKLKANRFPPHLQTFRSLPKRARSAW